MKKILSILIIFLMMYRYSSAQSKPVKLPDLKQWFAASENTRESLLLKEGFSKGNIIYDPEFGKTVNYTSAWKQFPDGYARFEQQVIWMPDHKILQLNTLSSKNYTDVQNELKKTAKYEGTDAQKIETYKDAVYNYSLQIVTSNEPLQKKHPSYLIFIYRAQ